jgi:hypothetical protein
MPRDDMVIFLVSSIFLLFFAMVIEKYAKEKQDKKLGYISVAMMGLAVYFICYTSLAWFGHAARVSGNMDIHLMYRGVAAEGSPYVRHTTVDSPTFFSLARFFTSVLGDGGKEAYSKFIRWGQYISLGIMLVCLTAAIISYVKSETKSWFGVASALCVCFIFLIPIGLDIGLGNTNVLATAGVVVYFALNYLSKRKLARFLSGVALGIAFMIKPHLFLVLVFLFCSAFKRKEYYIVGGVVTIGILGFLGSLAVPGIDVGAYIDFLSKNPDWLTNQRYRNNEGNLSLICYVPIEKARIVSTLCVLGFAVLAILTSMKKKIDEIPWFFITVVPLPVFWGAYIMTNVLPTAFFMILNREKKEQFVFCVLAMVLVYSSTIYNLAVLTNLILIGAGVWQITAGLLRKEVNTL